MAQDIEIKRVLKLEERYQEEIAELEQEIAIIDKQIANKEGQREQLDISIQHKIKYSPQSQAQDYKDNEAEVIVKRAQLYMDNSQSWIADTCSQMI